MALQDSRWIHDSFDAVFPPEAPLDRNAFPGVAKAVDWARRYRVRNNERLTRSVIVIVERFT